MLLVIKFIMLFFIICMSTYIGFLISDKYNIRVKELQNIITGLEIFETRISYSYDTIPECFTFISNNISTGVKNIFKAVSERLKQNTNLVTGDCFRDCVEEEKMLLNLTSEDIDILKGLSISLGQTDLENQVKNIRLTIQNLNMQLEMAKLKKEKNSKLFRNIGILVGLVLAIILV